MPPDHADASAIQAALSYRRPSDLTLPEYPEKIFARLVSSSIPLEHLSPDIGGPDVAWLFRTSPLVQGGRAVIGRVHRPVVTGSLRDLFASLLTETLGRVPDFIIALDLTYWLDASPLAREILVFHEACHIQQATDEYGSPRFNRDGDPVWTLRAHDVEEFLAVVERYGAHDADVRALIDAASGGRML